MRLLLDSEQEALRAAVRDLDVLGPGERIAGSETAGARDPAPPTRRPARLVSPVPTDLEAFAAKREPEFTGEWAAG